LIIGYYLFCLVIVIWSLVTISIIVFFT